MYEVKFQVICTFTGYCKKCFALCSYADWYGTTWSRTRLLISCEDNLDAMVLLLLPKQLYSCHPHVSYFLIVF